MLGKLIGKVIRLVVIDIPLWVFNKILLKIFIYVASVLILVAIIYLLREHIINLLLNYI